MNNCRTVEPLLYLYRDGERTEAEERIVQDHLSQCAACRGLLAELHHLDEELAGERAIAVDVENSLADEVLTRLAPPRHVPMAPARFVEYLLGSLRRGRPAFGGIVALFVGLLILQLLQDGLQVEALERRLQSRGESVRALTSRDDLQLWRELQPDSSWAPTAIARASFPGNFLDVVGPSLARIFQERGPLFERFERKYPGLSTITPDDGLDERERAILTTEGKAFLGEIQQLLREGELQR